MIAKQYERNVEGDAKLRKKFVGKPAIRGITGIKKQKSDSA
jgi:hypothetical protein